jgi:hypothetical protein
MPGDSSADHPSYLQASSLPAEFSLLSETKTVAYRVLNSVECLPRHTPRRRVRKAFRIQGAYLKNTKRWSP